MYQERKVPPTMLTQRRFRGHSSVEPDTQNYVLGYRCSKCGFTEQWTSGEKHINAIYQAALAEGWHINKKILCKGCHQKRKEQAEKRVRMTPST